MNKFSSMIENLKARREAMVSEGAFSLIDVVVTVAIVVALSVGGFIAYSGIVENAKGAATAAAADQVYTSALVAQNDGFGSDTEAAITDVVSKYNTSSKEVKVIVDTTADLKVYAAHIDSKIAGFPSFTATDAAAQVTAENKLVKVRG